MNFYELMQRMAELDKPVTEEPNEGNAFSGALDAAKDAGQDSFEVDGKSFKVKEDDVDECGMNGMENMPGGMMGMRNPGQQDSVNMNVSLNAAGAGGIRDLMGILKTIEDGGDMGGDMGMQDPAILIKKMQPPKMGGDDSGPGREIIGQEEYANSPDEMYASTQAVTGTGNDIHSKGKEAPKVNGGGNPMQPHVSEGLLAQLTNLYQEVKLR